MADTPASRHVKRALASKEAARTAGSNLMEGTTIYQQMQVRLASDRARLKQIQSTQGKAQLKTALLPSYAPYLDGVLSADAGGKDDIVSTLMLWHFDAGLFDAGLDIARYVLAHGLDMPDTHKRTAACVVAEEIGLAALNALKTSAPFDLNVIDRAATLTEGQDMPRRSARPSAAGAWTQPAGHRYRDRAAERRRSCPGHRRPAHRDPAA
ncbi:phage terminase small subunit [Stenotrophomonas phage Smp131]|uniref:Phage terminase small subunit n=1 Tax=Stenotrophomonas phage Smp131 TaxID=1168563 RepID=V9IQK3_9CAUD|nr:terminase small subunit [Stenotrophomonas phage Smp131]AFJ75480.1 phage terminase small subunit [Stenotrophomonas phage Smp131]